MHDENRDIERELRPTSPRAPRVTQSDVDDVVVSEYYFTAAEGVAGASGIYPHDQRQGQPLTLLSFCVLVLRNGFTVSGESACVSPENFDANLGRELARNNALGKVFPFLGYELKTKLHTEDWVKTG